MSTQRPTTDYMDVVDKPSEDKRKPLFSRRFKQAFTIPRTIAGVGVIVLLVIMVTAQWIAPHDPLAQDISSRFASVGTPGHWLGADNFGRDTLSRSLYGIQAELVVALSATMISLVFGTIIGLFAGYFRGVAEVIGMRGVDVILAFPPIIIALLAATLYGPGAVTLIVVLGILFIPQFARISYGQTLSISQKEFVEASEVFGASSFVRLFRVILPNIAAPIFVQFSLTMAAAVLLESGLSFLGLGIVPPDPSLGAMVAEGQRHMVSEPAVILVPAILLSLIILAFSLLGDALRDWLDPRK